MHMYTHVILLSLFCNDTEIIFITCIWCMRSQHKCKSVAVLKCIAFLICLAEPHLPAFIISAPDKTAAYHCTHA